MKTYSVKEDSMGKIKVMHYINSLDQGGAETLVKNYALLLDKQKIDLVVLVHDKKDTLYERELKTAGIRVRYATGFIHFVYPCKHYLLRRLIYKSGITKYIVRHIIRQENPDILHTHLRCNEIIKFAVAGLNIKIFHTVHSAPSAYWGDNSQIAKQDFESCAYLVKNHNMRLIALHKAMRKEINELFHIEDDCILNNGIDFNKFNIEESKESIRKSLDIPEDSFLVGHVGRFIAVKNHTFIVDIFNQLLKETPNAHLLLVGSGPLQDPTIKKIESLGIQNHVTILDSRSDMARIFKAMDVFILPSLWEGLPLVVIEAQKMKTPVIISSGVSEASMLSNLVIRMKPNADTAAWVHAIEESLIDNIEYYGIDQWDLNVVIKQLEKLYIDSQSQN